MPPLPLDPSTLPHDPLALGLLVLLGVVQLATLIYSRRTANSLRPPPWHRQRSGARRVLRALRRRVRPRADDTPAD